MTQQVTCCERGARSRARNKIDRSQRTNKVQPRYGHLPRGVLLHQEEKTPIQLDYHRSRKPYHIRGNLTPSEHLERFEYVRWSRRAFTPENYWPTTREMC